jgi:SPP1 family predicted phage head-tail adaptor|tara:strand:+ start:386 stop:709 length:324 start_codon:yes stop_codon:yes gene_type:complete
MSIGKMRFEIELQKPTNTRDAGGGITETFTTLSNLYADIRQTRGNESLKQGQVKEQTTHIFTIRYRKDIGTNFRIKYDDDNYNIRNIKNIDNRNRYLEVECELGVTG